MNDKTEDLLQDNRETLETVANADCSASWIAQRLLESIEGDTSSSTPEPTETDIGPNTEPENQSEPEGSIFAY